MKSETVRGSSLPVTLCQHAARVSIPRALVRRARWVGPGPVAGWGNSSKSATQRTIHSRASSGPLPGPAEQAQLPVAEGHPRPVSEFLVDGKGTPVPLLGIIIQTPPELGDHAELVVAAGHPRPVTQFLLDGQGTPEPLLRVIETPPVLGDDAELVEV